MNEKEENLPENVAERFLLEEDRGFELYAAVPGRKDLSSYKGGPREVRAHDNIDYDNLLTHTLHGQIEKITEDFEIDIDETLEMEHIPVIGGSLDMEVGDILKRSTSSEQAYIYGISVDNRLETEGPIEFSYDRGPYLTVVGSLDAYETLPAITDKEDRKNSYTRFLQAIIPEDMFPSASQIVQDMETSGDNILYDEDLGVEGEPIIDKE